MSNSKPYLTQKEVVRLNLIEALKFHNGNRTHTARGLGVGLRTLQRHLKAAGLSNYLKDEVMTDNIEIIEEIL